MACCKSATLTDAGRLGAHILVPLYFVRYLTFNGFLVLCPTERLDKTHLREHELPSKTLWAEFVSGTPLENRQIGKTQWLTPLP
jgi:hypothetical protein